LRQHLADLPRQTQPNTLEVQRHGAVELIGGKVSRQRKNAIQGGRIVNGRIQAPVAPSDVRKDALHVFNS
jgi:hypothetical protein